MYIKTYTFIPKDLYIYHETYRTVSVGPVGFCERNQHMGPTFWYLPQSVSL